MIIPNIEAYRQITPHLGRQAGGIAVHTHFDRSNPATDEKIPCQHQNPLVTIITVVYNGEEIIEETILSVLNQDYSNIEYIVIDGCSSDRTLDIIKKYDDRIFHWISEPDSGLYDAMNKALAVARGTFVGILNAGDYYTTYAVNTIVDEYQKQGVLGLYSGDCQSFLNDRDQWYLYSGRCTLPDRTLPHIATFVPLSVYEKYGLFDTTFKIAADFELLSRFYKYGVPLFHIRSTIAIASKAGLSGNHYPTYSECLRVRLRHHPSIIRSFSITGSEFIKVTIRMILERLNLWHLIDNLKNGSTY